MDKVNPEDRVRVRERPHEMPVMYQEWRDLLFLHWKYDKNEIQKTLPLGLYVDTFKGDAYLTIIPFFMENVQVAPFPQIPGLANFIEINLRTYVYDENGIPGIWFYSLDLNSLVVSKIARQTYSFPYFFAELTAQKNKEDHFLISGKRNEKPNVRMSFSYALNKNNSTYAKEGSLDYFLIERYVAFSLAEKQLYYNFVNHEPYPLNDGEIFQSKHTFWKEYGFNLLEDSFDYSQFSKGVNVDIYKPKKSVIYK